MTSTSINRLYDKARRGLAHRDAGAWEAAEAMAELREAGQTQQAIAGELGCSQKTVSNYVAVFAQYRGTKQKPPFPEAMAEYRGPRDHIPKTPERRAQLAADLLKDKAVADAPVVRKAVDRHTDRRLKQAAREFNQQHNIPTRTQQTHAARRTSVVVNKTFWRELLEALTRANRLLNDAVGELDRTGLPDGQAGDIIKAARIVGRSSERFGKQATARAVGAPMNRDTGS